MLRNVFWNEFHDAVSVRAKSFHVAEMLVGWKLQVVMVIDDMNFLYHENSCAIRTVNITHNLEYEEKN